MEREIVGNWNDKETRNRILDAATELFAIRGSRAVSMRDISKEVGIKMSSIYYYYESKEALFEAIVKRFEEGYRDYFRWLSEKNEKAETVEELMDNMFNREFVEMLNPSACLGMSLLLKEQHSNETARRMVYELFYEYSVGEIQNEFEKYQEEGLCGGKWIAACFMFSVLVMNDIRVHEYMGGEPPVDCREMYSGLRKMITAVLSEKRRER